MAEVPVWRSGREHHSRDTLGLASYRGESVARIHLAPALLVHRAVKDVRRAAAAAPDDDLSERWAAIARAGTELMGTLRGTSADEHARQVTLTTGTPLADTRRAMAELATGMAHITAALGWQAPGGDLDAWHTRRVRHRGGQEYAWVPAGQVLGFVAPANHPAVHLTWVLALAMGWTVAVRPGAQDPLTPWRVIQALAKAGFPAERVALLPGAHDLVPALVEACDRTVAYGGSELAALLGRDRRVLFNGPGHSKVLVDAPADTPAAADFLFECIAHHGGRKCTCASAVVVRGEVPGLLPALAERLHSLPLLDPLDPVARVPAWKDPSAVQRTPARVAVVDGIAFARPELVCCAPDDRRFGAELPAPWATASTLPAAADPLPLLRGSLSVTLLAPAERLRTERLPEACLLEPGIHKVFCGPIPPWHTEPGAPHNGRLADFLFVAKYRHP